MSDEVDPTLPIMMDQMRDLVSQLESMLAETFRKFEDTTGLVIEDIELIHGVNAELSDKRPIIRLSGIKVKVGL